MSPVDLAVVPEGRRGDFDRGMKALPEMDEVMPDEAEGSVAETYQDIRRVLRVPFVNFIFRALANEPGILVPAWQELRPRLRTRSFERAADHIRARAVLEPMPSAEGVRWPGGPDVRRIAEYTASIHYVLPKLLLVATALDRRLSGADEPDSPPRGPQAWGLGAEEPIPEGVAKGATALPLVEPEEAEGELAKVFRDIRERHGHPGIASYYRGLGHWPELLAGLWGAIREDVGGAEYLRVKDHVIHLAASHEAGLPGREKVEPPDVPAVVPQLLAVFRFHLIPDLLLDVGRIQGLLGGPGAPYRSRLSEG